MFALEAKELVGFSGVYMRVPRQRTRNCNSQIFFCGHSHRLSVVQGVLVNQGVSFRVTVSVLHFEVLKLISFSFDQSFKFARLVCRDRQSLTELTFLYSLVSSAYNAALTPPTISPRRSLKKIVNNNGYNKIYATRKNLNIQEKRFQVFLLQSCALCVNFFYKSVHETGSAQPPFLFPFLYVLTVCQIKCLSQQYLLAAIPLLETAVPVVYHVIGCLISSFKD